MGLSCISSESKLFLLGKFWAEGGGNRMGISASHAEWSPGLAGSPQLQ